MRSGRVRNAMLKLAREVLEHDLNEFIQPESRFPSPIITRRRVINRVRPTTCNGLPEIGRITNLKARHTATDRVGQLSRRKADARQVVATPFMYALDRRVHEFDRGAQIGRASGREGVWGLVDDGER